MLLDKLITIQNQTNIKILNESYTNEYNKLNILFTILL
jgi:hypothetical protein